MVKKFLEPFAHYKYLLSQLVNREIKARYKQSFMGYAWVLVNPLAQLLVYTFVFSLVFKSPTQGIPYPIFLFVGLLPWTLFHNSVFHGTQSLVQNESLLKKVSFPREIIPYSVIFSKLIDFFFSAVIFLCFLLLFKVEIAATSWLFFPLFAIQLILTVGLTLILSAANLFYRDVQYLVNLILMLWMYLTPIVYPLAMVPTKYLWLYELNPLVGIIEGYRAVIFGTTLNWSVVYWSLAISTLIFILGFLLFKKAEKVFADIV